MTADATTLLRFLFAIAIWLLPGIALTRSFGPHLPRGDQVLRVAVAFSLAAGVSTALALLGLALRWPADRLYLPLVAAAGAALIWLLLGSRLRRTGGSGPDPSPAPTKATAESRPPRWTQLAGWLTLLTLAAAGLALGASLRYTSDAPDHVGYLREILFSGRYFPTDAFHLDAGILGADARKGLLHPVYAALVRITGRPAVDVWNLLPAVTALFPFLSSYGFLRLGGYPARWAVIGGWIVLLTWGGGPSHDLIGIAPFTNNLGATLFWFASGAALFALRRPGRPAVLLAAATAFAAVAVHPMFLVFVALLYGILGLYAVTAAPRRAESLRTLIQAGVLAAIPLIPYLIYRYGLYAPGNPIHTHLQGMLLLSDRFYTADPMLMWKHIRWTGLVAYPLALIVFLPRWRRGPAEFFFGVATFVMLNFTFNPLLVPLLQAKITYLIFRSFWFFHPGLAAAAVLPALFAVLPRGLDAGVVPVAPARSRWQVGAAVLLLAAIALPALRTVPTWGVTPARRYPHLDPLSWRGALEEVDRLVPARAVVLSDPITSHVLPAFASQKVVACYDQHSPPNDARAVERIQLVRDALSPSTSPARAWRLTRDAGAGYVLINRAFTDPPPTDYWDYDAASQTAAARSLAASPYFEPLWEGDGFLLLEAVVRPEPGIEDTAWTPPGVSPVPLGADTLHTGGGIALLSVRPSTHEVIRGDSLTVAFLWTPAGDEVDHRPLRNTLRLDAVDAPGRGSPVGKLIRKAVEKTRGQSFRDRVQWIPTENHVPPDRWRAGDAVADTLSFRVSPRLEPGRYVLTVSMNRFPHMTNHRWRDYVNDDDLYSGPPLDTLTVRAR